MGPFGSVHKIGSSPSKVTSAHGNGKMANGLEDGRNPTMASSSESMSILRGYFGPSIMSTWTTSLSLRKKRSFEVKRVSKRACHWPVCGTNNQAFTMTEANTGSRLCLYRPKPEGSNLIRWIKAEMDA